jgi:cytochrome c peroxidase
MSKRRVWRAALIASSIVCAGTVAVSNHAATAGGVAPGLVISENGAGQLRTLNVNGAFDLNNAFFADIGTNGRSCLTCHQPQDGWSITPATVRARFLFTSGRDPIFRNNDGSNCEGATPRTRAEQREAYSLLMNRGLIRVGLDVPAGAEFILERATDPYDCAPGSNDVSAYRRPLPSTNVRFLSAVMWDGRESGSTTTTEQDLLQQANDATRGHAAASRDLTPAEAHEIVDFESGLYTAQARDGRAGSLRVEGAHGGPAALSREPFFIGINDPIGLNPSGEPFTPNAFTLFDGWSSLPSHLRDRTSEARRAIARGAAIFNTKSFTISGVSGLNGETFPNQVTVPASLTGTCTVCHDSTNAGSHSVKAPLDLGLTAPSVAPYLPVYRLTNIATGEQVETTDPGRALVSGKWKDIGRFKGPVLRGLAARAPYFHNGAAASLAEVVDFYDSRFTIGLTPREKADLVAFLRAL